MDSTCSNGNIMRNTCFLLFVFVHYVYCTSGALAPGQRTNFAVTVSANDNASFSDAAATHISMFMNSKLTKTFRLTVLCTNSVDVRCIEIEPMANTGMVVKIEDSTEICLKCDVINTSSANISRDFQISSINPLNESILENRDVAIYITKTVNLTFISELLGVTEFQFKVTNVSDDVTTTSKVITGYGSVNIKVKVVRQASPLDIVFVICVYFLEIFEMLVFGTQLDFATLEKTFRRPMLPLIGFVCQYVGMPLIAFCIAKSVTGGESLSSLGIFVAGICPGGGGSNIYTYLLGGDLSLSITMTTISTIMSLGMIPLWLYTLGQEFLDQDNATIPYTDILVVLSIILVPLAVGLFIQYKIPRAVKRLEQILTGVITVVALALIVVGVYANLYIFQLMTLKIVIIGCTLPYIGFFLGGSVSLLLGLPVEKVKTIAIETGMQNTGVGYILLYNSLSEPYSDIASVAPVSSEIMSPIPPTVIAIVYIIHQKCFRKYAPVPQKTERDTPSSSQSETSNTGQSLNHEKIFVCDMNGEK